MKKEMRTCSSEKRKRKFIELEENENTSDKYNEDRGLEGLGNMSIFDDQLGEGNQASSCNPDYQQKYKVLGQTSFNVLKKINVTTSWINNATLFSAELHKVDFAELSSFSELPAPIADMKAVLPVLLKDVNQVPVLRAPDIAISAPTGSGKTLCYVLPILAQVGPKPSGILRALVIAPVQTLVKQIEQEFAFFNGCGAVISVLSGATDFLKEQRHLAPKGVCISDIIISTPGRLMDHITDPSSGIDLSSLRFLVVDEADRMTDMVRQEWLEVVERRSGGLVDEEIKSLDHVSGQLSLPSCIQHTVLVVDKKFHPLVLYLKVLENNWKKVLVFTNEKDSALRLKILLSYLAKSVFTVENLTGDLFGRRRDRILKRFKNGSTQVLISSDVLSRGIDVENIECVINYDLPKNDRLFVHRAGRSGRVGRPGHVLSLASGEARKTFVKNVLKKNGLWLNAQELVVDDHMLEPHLVSYQDALYHLKNTLIETKKVDPREVNLFYNSVLEIIKMSGLLTDIISDSLALNASQEWEEAFLYTPFLNDQALSYEYAECLAAQTFLRIARLSYFVKQRPNAEFISPTGRSPLLKIRRTLIPEFSGIVDFVAKKGIKLCSHLSDAQIAEMRAQMSVMDVLLRNVEVYVMWKHNETYEKLTRYRYGSVYKWPLNRILPAMKRREMLTKLQDNGWADKVWRFLDQESKCSYGGF
ncbi:helicase protein [Dictyocaulus viviparus]|uniref:ATP-dependent RNA helicase n=1 Tax=Dictyocaulus viviparus TaxID=29172 RepID=A0A0D8XD34_DICVI|nr:helicase protein [Dictyocaulus viviparus]